MAEQSGGSALQEFSDALAAAVEQAGAYTVRVNARRRLPASGIAWAEGIILTADHVVERDEEITVGLPDGREVPATIGGRDPGSDLAILRAQHGLAPAPHAEGVKVGHLALAVGRPGKEGLTASMGVVSSIGGRWRGGRRSTTVEGYIRADITMYPGFSGGPLVDASGRVIGLNSSAIQGGLTIPAAAAQTLVGQLQQHGKLKRGYLGLTSQPVRLPASLSGPAGQETGLLIARVEPDSPAEQGGLLIGDILIGVAGQPVRDTDELQRMLGGERVGQPTPVRVVRGGEVRDVTVTIGERT